MPLYRAALLSFAAALTHAQTRPVEELNKTLPKYIQFKAEYRVRLEGFRGGAFQNATNDFYELGRLRADAIVQPTRWMKFHFQTQDSWSPHFNRKPHGPPLENRLDLRWGFFELGDTEKGAWAVRTGRQSLIFGAGRLMGDPAWSNTGRTWDAVRLTLRDKKRGLRLDTFTGAVVKLRADGFDQSEPGDNLHGLYGGLEKLVPKGLIEPYLYWRVRVGGLNFWVPGFRAAGQLPRGFDYSIEGVLQRGSFRRDTVSAHAAHGWLGRTMPKWRGKPRFWSEYNYASGDRDPSDRQRGTFDQLYPAAHDRIGFSDQIGWKNIHHWKTAADIRPWKSIAIIPSYHQMWLASARDGLYATNNAIVARRADGSAGRHVGQEFDLTGTFAVNKTFTIAAGFAHLHAGGFLRKATRDGHNYSFPFFSLLTSF